MKHTTVPYRILCLLKVNETRIHFLGLKQGRQNGTTDAKIFHILLKIDHIVFKKQ